MTKILPPTAARTNFYKVIKETNRDSRPTIIQGTDEGKSAVIIGEKDYDAMQETTAVSLSSQIGDALNRERDDSVELAQMMREVDDEAKIGGPLKLLKGQKAT
ncbi:type II toxin-antitoxin system Phd/YefM family antitoxin [Lactobacillus sp. XV13L]|nr:type II toxin-antitoxin system Phd/YefM family antitoxin [Lactobacillus sp. XV13L]